MCNKIIDIYLNETDLKQVIDKLNNNSKYLILNGNLFSIDKILSCFEIVIDNTSNEFSKSNFCYFEFSYNDGIINKLFRIKSLFEDEGAYGFLKTTTYINEEHLTSIIDQIYNLSKENSNIKSLSNNLYNEALIFVTSGINSTECKDVKDDFESKFVAYQNKQIEYNNSIINLMNTLHDKIIDIKVK